MSVMEAFPSWYLLTPYYQYQCGTMHTLENERHWHSLRSAGIQCMVNSDGKSLRCLVPV